MNAGKQARGLTANNAEQIDDQQFFIVGDGKNLKVGEVSFIGRGYEQMARQTREKV